MKILISAGGTGGHIFPGVAVAEAFIPMEPENQVVFVGTTTGLEGRLIPQYGFRLLHIQTNQFLGKNILSKVVTLIGLLRGIKNAVTIIRKERPDAILGMGGFTSVPVVLAGFLLRVPSFIHEQNVEPGLANRLLSRYARATFVSFDETKQYLKKAKSFHTGNPLRRLLKVWEERRDEGTFAVFVFGGSRGARSINESILTLLPYMESYKNSVIYHQTGTEDYEKMKGAYEKAGVRHEIFPFTDHMERYYNLSDLVISRAGATTIFELALFKKAAILIPYPFSTGQHQWKNASYVESIGGAYLIHNDEATGERLHDTLRHCMKEPDLLKRMGTNIGAIYVEDAAERIISHIYEDLDNGIS